MRIKIYKDKGDIGYLTFVIFRSDRVNDSDSFVGANYGLF
jgi:hypothetical protein